MFERDRHAELEYYSETPPIQSTFGTSFNIGLDLATTEETYIPGMEYVEVDFGVVLQPPPGYWLMMVARSSTFKKWGVILTNGVGVIDPSYCGPKDTVKGLFYNPHPEDMTIPAGTRLVQIICIPIKLAIVVHNPKEPVGVNRGGVGSTGD